MCRVHNPDGFSINARCIDSETIGELTITPFNGREWEAQYPKGQGGTGKNDLPAVR